jgi:uncharacterized protein YdeI (YjbR/CyaY-like superfamily)
MKELDYIHFKSKNEFRKWLHKYHKTSSGIWMVYYKKDSKIDCIKYDAALEEALCFGWIDSLIKKLDDIRYARKFTPRTDTKKWSELNKKKVIELMNKGMMTQYGLIKIDSFIKTGKVDWVIDKSDKKKPDKTDIPEFILEEMAKNEPALSNFNKLSPTYKRHYILWITTARREATVQKRLKESIILLKENKKLGLK